MFKKLLSCIVCLALVAGLELLAPQTVLAEDGAAATAMESARGADADVGAVNGGPSMGYAGGQCNIGDTARTDSAEGEILGDLLGVQETSYGQPAYRSIKEIREFLSSHPFNITSPDTYAVQPSHTPPYAAGELSAVSVQNALNALNAMRYVAGVGHDVACDPTYQQYAQAAALVSRVNGILSHDPSKPEDMDDALYQLGHVGASRSNLAGGCMNAADSILLYLEDWGENNRGVAGHRRWILSSRLGRVGIGQVNDYNATYVIDDSDDSLVTDVAWPARKMPTNFFKTGRFFFDLDIQWSLSTITQGIGTSDSITVLVRRRRDNKVWELSNSQISVNDGKERGLIYGNDGNGCILWSLPDVGGYRDGDVFDVTVEGDRSSKSYSVEFFKIYTADDLRHTPFVDVTGETGHAEDVCWLHETEISQGWGRADGTAEFRPYASVARADMAAFLFRLARRWGIVDDSWQPTGFATFSDVDGSTAHYREIMWLAEQGISEGWRHADGTAEFRPYASVARADMAAFLLRLASLREDSIETWQPSEGKSFSDVAVPKVDGRSGTPHYNEIMWLAEQGISEGWRHADGTAEFRPFASVARADMAAFLHRLSDLG